jgi:hypothetical protein
MDQVQGNQVKLTSHIKDGKEQQRVIQTQVLQLSSEVSNLNTSLDNVASERATSKTAIT